MAEHDRDEGTPLPATPEGTTDSRPAQLAQSNQMLSRRTLKWVSTKTPATSVGEALQENVKGFTLLEKGIHVSKVTSRGQIKQRVVTISQDKFALFCTHRPLKRGKGVLSTMATKISVPFVTRKGIRGFMGGEELLRDRYVRYIDVADIDAVHVGVLSTQKLEYARTENRLKGLDSPIDGMVDKVVSIIHHGHETLDLVVPDRSELKELVNCLRLMVGTYHQARKKVSNDALLLRYIWYDVDTNRDGRIGETEFTKILSRINLYVKNPRKIFRDHVKQVGATGSSLTYGEVMTLLQMQKNTAKSKSMANQIWDELFGSSTDTVDVTEFMTKFVHIAQGDILTTIEQVRELFMELNDMEMNHQVGETDQVKRGEEISRARFEVYLHHEMNDAYDPMTISPDADVALDRPMSRYWINTSHNTYLTGDQLQSTSSVEMYMRSLRRGCKCLELDCWDGEKSPNGEPIPVVFHGHTLTSKITFADIIRVVYNYLIMNKDSYPIILSLENHCSHPYQIVMANVMKQVFGHLLYIPQSGETFQDLPSPESLRGKVVIKGKRPPEKDAKEETEIDTDQDDGAGGDYDPYAAGSNQSPSKQKPPAELPKIAKELADLTLFHGTKYKNFEASIAGPCSHMHSIGETKIGKILGQSAANTSLWRLYNVHHMTRTYPAGARVDSSNYNPLVAWSVGCQLVALNFQTSDAPLLMNDGLFRQNGGCGYLLKPERVLGKTTQPDPVKTVKEKKVDEGDFLDDIMNNFEEVACGEESTRKLMERSTSSEQLRANLEAKEESRMVKVKPLRLKIRVLSGSCLPKPRGAKNGETIDPYVTITVHDVIHGKNATATLATKSLSTKSITDNGFCPVWNDLKDDQFVVHSPDVALVQFSLNEQDVALDDRVADSVIPLPCLRQGYRSIQLYDHNNTRTGPFGFATLLVEIRTFTFDD